MTKTKKQKRDIAEGFPWNESPQNALTPALLNVWLIEKLDATDLRVVFTVVQLVDQLAARDQKCRANLDYITEAVYDERAGEGEFTVTQPMKRLIKKHLKRLVERGVIRCTMLLLRRPVVAKNRSQNTSSN